MKSKDEIKHTLCSVTLVILIIIAILLVIQIELISYQGQKYIVDVYDCSDMSKDCEERFESIGLSTMCVCGENKYKNSSHMWLLVDFGLFTANFESTKLMFLPESFYESQYKNIKYSDGYIIDGECTDELSWWCPKEE